MDRVQVRLFGRLQVIVDGRTTSRFRTQKTASMLAYLAYHVGSSRPREELIDMFWEDSEPAAARNSLSQSLSSIRQVLEPEGGDIVVADRYSIGLNPSALLVDTVEFRRLASQGNVAGALEFYKAPLLEGLHDDWIDVERELLRERLRQLIENAVQGRSPEDTFEIVDRWSRADPTSELAAFQVVRAAKSLGKEEDAREAYARLERALRPLGLRPDRKITELVGTFRAELIGEQQITAEPSFEPVLPSFRSTFIGRERERERLAALLSPTTEPVLVSVLGPGGAGKTRLCAEVAHDLAGVYRDRVWFVHLADARDVEDVHRMVGAILGVTATGGSSLEAAIVSRLSNRPCLLVLDNMEQLVEDRAVVADLGSWSKVPGVKVLTSSRRRIGFSHEVEVRLSALEEPSLNATPESVLASESGALFVERVKSVRPEFELTNGNAVAIAEICHALEGLPLALELAASRAQVMGILQMRDRLSQRLDLFAQKDVDLEGRHHTLRHAIDWSYQMLTEDLRDFFVRLGVFSGGWCLEIAETALVDPLALDSLARLVDFSLVVEESGPVDQVRFRLLETIGLFVKERFANEPGKDAHRERHASALLAFAERREPTLILADKTALSELDAEHDNLRDAMTWCEQSGDGESAARFLAALWRFWHLRGYVAEGRRWAKRLLAVGSGSSNPYALHGAGRLAYLQGDYDDAERNYLAVRDLARDDRSLAHALMGLGSVAYERGQHAAARGQFLEALRLYRSAGDDPGVAAALNWLGIVDTETRNYPRATEALAESLLLRKRIGDESGVARALISLGVVKRQTGDLVGAREHYLEAYEIHHQVGDLRAEASCLSNLGFVATRLGDHDEARRRLEEGISIQREIGDRWGLSASLANLGNLEAAEGRMEFALVYLRESLRLRQSIGNQIGIVLSLEGIATVRGQTGDPPTALRLLEACRLLREKLGIPLAPSDEPELSELRGRVQSALGSVETARIVEEAAGQPLDEVIALALEN